MSAIANDVRSLVDLAHDRTTHGRSHLVTAIGDMMGDHKMMYKNVFYRGSVRVPNIVRPPGGMKGKSVDGLVESIDLSARSQAPCTRSSASSREPASPRAKRLSRGSSAIIWWRISACIRSLLRSASP